MRNTSWQEKLGLILGGLIGNNYREKDENRRINKMGAFLEYNNSTLNDYLKKNPKLLAAIQNPNLTDEDWDNLSREYNFDVSKFKGISNFYRNILQEGLNWQNATDDIGRQTAATRGEELRQKFAEKFQIPLNGFSKDDIITEETFRKNILPLLNSQFSDLYQKNRQERYLARGGDPKLLDIIGFNKNPY